MFVDASALLAILLQEPDADSIADALERAPRLLTSPIARYETVAALTARKTMPVSVAQERLLALLYEAGIETMEIDEEVGLLALRAFERYGRGRGHPAQLNMGDCFAYACAKARRIGLIYKGDDFSRTDLA
ncbi:MAG: type II toxin-antitoxin system VapC family toxin [Alphaproteobacteria bacterium]